MAERQIKKWITINGKHVPIYDEDPSYTSVDAWYDRNTRSWIIQKKDAEGNQVGDADIVGTKQEKDFIVKELESKLDEGKLSFEKGNPKMSKWIEKAFDKANLIGEDVDLWSVIYSYKVFQNLTNEQQEELYDYLAERLGFYT